uniref:Uncharacterized protein n=2 Tax=Anguilla anguilla TaxID=7936 RepID=A0A0E9VRK0_ANGAN
MYVCVCVCFCVCLIIPWVYNGSMLIMHRTIYVSQKSSTHQELMSRKVFQ